MKQIKYEGIQLQKCLIACMKGINVVVRFQYSEIGWLNNIPTDLKTKSFTVNWEDKKVDPVQHLQKSAKSQKSFETC